MTMSDNSAAIKFTFDTEFTQQRRKPSHVQGGTGAPASRPSPPRKSKRSNVPPAAKAEKATLQTGEVKASENIERRPSPLW